MRRWCGPVPLGSGLNTIKHVASRIEKEEAEAEMTTFHVMVSLKSHHKLE